MDGVERKEFRSEIVRKEMKKLRRRKRQRIIKSMILLTILFALCVFVTAKSVLIDNKQIEITNYKLVSDKINTSIRLVIMSDLHNSEFGEKNEQLVSRIKTLEPDIILMAGDMVNDSEADVSVVIELCSSLTQIAPVYYTLGNHEGNLMYTGEKIPLDEYLYHVGVHFLYTNYEEIIIKDNTIRIGAMAADSKTYDESCRQFIEEFDSGDKFEILIAHYPDLFPEKLQSTNIDLGIAGHYHGGLIRIPGIGGLFHWDTGFFPRYAGGQYPWGEGTLIVTRGLGNHGLIPRINNKPEVAVVDIGRS